MEVSIARSEGLEKDSIVSMRFGLHRRQASVGSNRVYAFPTAPVPGEQLQVDVYQLITSGFVSVGADNDDCSVFFPTSPGASPKSLSLKVHPGCSCSAAASSVQECPRASVQTQLQPMPTPDTSAAVVEGCVSPKRGSAVGSRKRSQLNEDMDSARAYLQGAGLVEILQGVIRDLLRDKPVDCLVELTKRLQKLVAHRQTSDVATHCEVPAEVQQLTQERDGLLEQVEKLKLTQKEAFQEQFESEGPTERRSSDAWRATRMRAEMASPSRPLEEADSDDELHQEPRAMLRKRGLGVSAEAFGAWNNRRAAFVPPMVKKSDEERASLLAAFKACPLFAHLDHVLVETVVNAMPIDTLVGETCIIRQGDEGDCLFCLVSGTIDVVNYKTDPPKKICTLPAGRIFGELAMLYNIPRTFSIYTSPGPACVVAKLGRSVYQNLIVRHQMRQRERREQCLCRARCLETLNATQIAQLCDALVSRQYEEGDTIVRQGETGDEFFIVQSGVCSATVEIGTDEGDNDVQEHRRYKEGDLFGERSLLKRCERAATVTAISRVEVLCLNRASFERLLGPLSLLQRQNYMTDPRKCISDFYKSGDKRGCRGCIRDSNFAIDQVAANERTDWFTIFRPTSREAISLMLGSLAVGKGLNVKGKSAKKGRYSGLVPFLQISLNAHKELIGRPDPKGRVKIFYLSELDRTLMLKKFEELLCAENGLIFEGDRVIFYVDLYPGVFGLDIPEALLFDVYITNADIEFQAGADTGRKSEPDFMDMNFNSIRAISEPKLVLLQADREDPKNPQSLLLAYAERNVKPVVSDFDVFLTGSRNMEYDRLPPEQSQLQQWAIENAEGILRNPGPGSWTTRWLEVVKKASEAGFYPKTPQFGFGDATSYRITKEVVVSTSESGAIRHGAECFNFFFPQELDDEYLVIWDGFDGKQWEYLFEDDLRDWLLERAQEGYDFPMNPIWPIRDPGWGEIYDEMKGHEGGQRRLMSCFPDPEVRGSIERLMEEFPDGFQAHGTGVGGVSRKSLLLDIDHNERANLAMGDSAVSYMSEKATEDAAKAALAEQGISSAVPTHNFGGQ